MPAADLALVMGRIALAGKLIAGELARASIVGGLGFSGDTNVHGEEQKKLDDWTNEVFPGTVTAPGRRARARHFPAGKRSAASPPARVPA